MNTEKKRKSLRIILPIGLLVLQLLVSCGKSDQPIATDRESDASKQPTGTVSTASESTEQPLITTPAATPTTTAPVTETPPVVEPHIPSDDEMVLLSEYLPEALLDIRYATENNFTGQVIYENSDAYLRYGTVKKLKRAAELLAEEGYILLIWDAWRPANAQWRLWEICPDGNFVSDPNKGYSSHTRGGTVDISLLDAYGNEVPMPTEFDDFSAEADRDYSEIAPEAAENARLLENIMVECGFTPYQKEWWHYTDTNRWDVLEQLPE